MHLFVVQNLYHVKKCHVIVHIVLNNFHYLVFLTIQTVIQVDGKLMDKTGLYKKP